MIVSSPTTCAVTLRMIEAQLYYRELDTQYLPVPRVSSGVWIGPRSLKRTCYNREIGSSTAALQCVCACGS